jgi:hypothetical protein
MLGRFARELVRDKPISERGKENTLYEECG